MASIRALAAAAVVASVPLSANAVTLGQLDVVGNLNPSNSVYSPTGQIDFVGDASATVATGVFSPVVTIDEALLGPVFSPTVFSLFDIEFEEAAPQLIYSGGGFSFFASAFMDFDDELPGRGFSADGFATGPSGRLPGMVSLSSQVTDLGQTLVSFSSTTTVIPVPATLLMFLSALGGFGLLSYRNSRLTA